MMPWLKQWLCSHRYDIADITERDAAGNVSCKCHKCGKVNTADCGLHLPGRFDRYTTDRSSSAANGVAATAKTADGGSNS